MAVRLSVQCLSIKKWLHCLKIPIASETFIEHWSFSIFSKQREQIKGRKNFIQGTTYSYLKIASWGSWGHDSVAENWPGVNETLEFMPNTEIKWISKWINLLSDSWNEDSLSCFQCMYITPYINIFANKDLSNFFLYSLSLQGCTRRPPYWNYIVILGCHRGFCLPCTRI